MGDMKNAHKILVGKPGENRPLRSIILKQALRKMGLEGVDCIHLAQDRDCWWAIVNMVMNLLFP
jgi:hypothetical protein